MNKKNESQLNMFDAVITYCNNNAVLIATVPAFQSALNSLQANVAQLHSVAQLQADVITGITTDKILLKENLSSEAAQLAASVFAFATTAKNNALKERVNFAPSALKIMKDEMLVAASGNIRDAANANIASLGDYGINAVTMAAFQSVIDAYTAQISSPRNAVSQRSSYSKTLAGLFKSANTILKAQLDKMALQFKITNEDFYNTYKSNRTILDPRTSATQIAGVITSAADSQPVEGATVLLVGSELSAISDLTGSYTLKPVGIGNQSIKITKAGFVDDTIPNILVKLGKTAAINAAMVAKQA